MVPIELETAANYLGKARVGDVFGCLTAALQGKDLVSRF